MPLFEPNSLSFHFSLIVVTYLFMSLLFGLKLARSAYRDGEKIRWIIGGFLAGFLWPVVLIDSYP